MRVICKRRFRDLKSNVFREVGDTFEVDQERLDEINSAPYGELVEVVASPVAKTSQGASTRSRRKTRTTKTAEQE